MSLDKEVLKKGVWFKSAVPGLYYCSYKSAGDVECVLIDGKHYYQKEASQQPVEADAEERCDCGRKLFITRYCSICDNDE